MRQQTWDGSRPAQIENIKRQSLEYFTDEESAKDVREGLDTEFDSQVTTDGVYNSYVRISYFNDGWPQEVVSQDNISLGDRQKLKQKYITWDYRSVGHAE